MIRKFIKSIFATVALLICSASSASAEPRVVVTINPIHSLVAAVMEGVAEPALLVSGTYSVHGYQIKPSDAQLLQDADLVVWIGPELETSLISSITNLTENAITVQLSEIAGLTLHENRESPDAHMHGDDDHGEDGHHDEHEEHGHDEEHDHDKKDGDHDEDHHDEHDEHGHDEHDMEHGEDSHDGDDHDEDHHDEHEEHGHDEHDEHDMEHGEDGHDDHDDHAHGAWDMHIWLDVDNAQVIARSIAATLIELNPENESVYKENLDNTLHKLAALDKELHEATEPIAGKPYIVFHDAYQYLEKKYHLANVGAVALNPERSPGVRKVIELKETVLETGATCAFNEPQFSPRVLNILTEETGIKLGVIDPLGADVEAGPDAYFELLRNMVNSIRGCLLM